MNDTQQYKPIRKPAASTDQRAIVLGFHGVTAKLFFKTIFPVPTAGDIVVEAIARFDTA